MRAEQKYEMVEIVMSENRDKRYEKQKRSM